MYISTYKKFYSGTHFAISPDFLLSWVKEMFSQNAFRSGPAQGVCAAWAAKRLKGRSKIKRSPLKNSFIFYFYSPGWILWKRAFPLGLNNSSITLKFHMHTLYTISLSEKNKAINTHIKSWKGKTDITKPLFNIRTEGGQLILLDIFTILNSFCSCWAASPF